MHGKPENLRELWTRISGFLRTPVIRKYSFASDLKLYNKAGISALCEYSLLSDNAYPTYAVTKKEITASGIKSIREVGAGEEIGCVVLELGYFIDFENKALKDPLSVALSMTEEEQKDERVCLSVKEMLEEYL